MTFSTNYNTTCTGLSFMKHGTNVHDNSLKKTKFAKL